MFWSFAKLTPLDSRNSFFVFCVDYTYSVPDHDEAKTAIWPASVPILDGWYGQLPLGKILVCVTFRVSQSTPKREAKIWARMALATVQYYRSSMRTSKREAKVWARMALATIQYCTVGVQRGSTIAKSTAFFYGSVRPNGLTKCGRGSLSHINCYFKYFNNKERNKLCSILAPVVEANNNSNNRQQQQ
jgi:hypothetical protein